MKKVDGKVRVKVGISINFRPIPLHLPVHVHAPIHLPIKQ